MRLFALLLAVPSLSFDCSDEALGDVLKRLATEARIRIVADEACRGRITLDVEDWPLADVIEAIAKQAGGRSYLAPSGTWHVVPEWQRPLLRALHERKIAIRMHDAAPLPGVLAAVRAATGVSCFVDPALEPVPEVAVEAEDVTAAALLDLVTRPRELAWDLRYGGAFVTTPARLRSLPRAPLTGTPWPDVRVERAWRDAALADVLEDLAQTGGMRIGLPEGLDAARVTLEVHDLAFRDALALLLAPRGLSASAHDGAIHIAAY